MPTQEATWKQIDHELVTLKLHEVALNLHRETEKKQNDIYWRNRANKNTATVSLELFELELRQMKQWVFNLYSLYKEVWKIQGKEETPQFSRAVYRKAILPLIESRTGCSRDFLTGHATRTSLSRSVLASHLLELGREAERLRSEWRRRIEIEAMELEHAGKRPVQRREPRDNALESSGGKRRVRFRDASVARRTVIIENVKKSRAGLKGISQNRKIAQTLTEMKIPPPRKWNVSDFNAAYRDTKLRPRLDTMIAKVKVD